MGRDVFPCLSEDFQPGREASRIGARPLAAMPPVIPGRPRKCIYFLGLREKLEQRKEAERGQGSAYHQEELSEIHRFSLIAEAKLPGLVKPHRIRSPPQCPLPTSPLPPAPGDPSPPLPLPLLFTQLEPLCFLAHRVTSAQGSPGPSSESPFSPCPLPQALDGLNKYSVLLFLICQSQVQI